MNMKLNAIVRRLSAPSHETKVGWLRDDLRARGVVVQLTESCLREFVKDATSREDVASRAEFIEVWTLSDASIDPALGRLRDIARQYALPRPWKLSVPVAVAARRPTPIYLRWASAG
jgi:hypothetical protein